MTRVAARELRNDTAGLLRRVAAGEDVTITVHGEPVAQLTPVRNSRRRWVSREELAERLDRSHADSGFTVDLQRIAGDTTDELGPLE